MQPTFYDAAKVGTVYEPRWPDILQAGLEARKDVVPAAKDKIGQKVALLSIDDQVGFCNQDVGTLYVPGAEDDIRRGIDFLFKNLEHFTSLYASLDTHLAYHIFYSLWWMDKSGKLPDPFTLIPVQDVENGTWMPTVDPVESVKYVKELKAQGNKDLCIWPFHTMLGTLGHIMDPALYEAFFYHAVARRTQTVFLTKGMINNTEMYGILSPEVRKPNHPQGGFNTDFLKMLMNHDKLFIMGQAKSHCVLASIIQIHDYFKDDDPDILKKVYILEDCMSSVQHPQVDFEAIAQAAFDTFRNSGINIVKSTDVDLA